VESLKQVGETFCGEFEVYTLDNYARFATAVAEVGANFPTRVGRVLGFAAFFFKAEASRVGKRRAEIFDGVPNARCLLWKHVILLTWVFLLQVILNYIGA